MQADCPKHILVLIKGWNATFSYYLESRLGQSGVPFAVHSIESGLPEAVDPDGLFVIICRYIDRRHVRWLERNRTRLSGIAYFVDDDVASLVAGPEGALVYRTYVAYFACLQIARLGRLISAVWVSTPQLQAALAPYAGKVEIVPPRPVLALNLPLDERPPSGPLRIAFHATDIHGGEHRFLVPTVRQVLAIHGDVRFEVVARGGNRRLWQRAGIDPAQIRILPLAPWPDYLRRTRHDGADILLVPLLDTRLNAARADTKRIDACRMGAAAVFSAGEAYGRRRHADEILLDNRPESWVTMLNALIDDLDKRRAAAAGTRAVVESMAASPPRLPIGTGEG